MADLVEPWVRHLRHDNEPKRTIYGVAHGERVPISRSDDIGR
jgi:hypothetical protein